MIESDVYNYGAEYFFSLAHWAREEEELEPWERRFIYSIGKYLTQGWQISKRQEHQALRIVQILFVHPATP
jgi:hypothetical protein